MMSIVYIYLFSYLEIDEQFGITAKIDADFLLKADQRHWRHDISDVTSYQIVENHGLFWRHVQLVI